MDGEGVFPGDLVHSIAEESGWVQVNDPRFPMSPAILLNDPRFPMSPAILLNDPRFPMSPAILFMYLGFEPTHRDDRGPVQLETNGFWLPGKFLQHVPHEQQPAPSAPPAAAERQGAAAERQERRSERRQEGTDAREYGFCSGCGAPRAGGPYCTGCSSHLGSQAASQHATGAGAGAAAAAAAAATTASQPVPVLAPQPGSQMSHWAPGQHAQRRTSRCACCDGDLTSGNRSQRRHHQPALTLRLYPTLSVRISNAVNT